MEPTRPNTVPVACPHCGALQEADPSRDRVFCQNCGQPYVPAEARTFGERWSGVGLREREEYAPPSRMPAGPGQGKPKKKRRRPFLWVLAAILVLAWLAPRLSGLRDRITGRSLPAEAPITREAVSLSSPRPTATPRPTVKPTATPRPTARPTATPGPTVKPTATPAPTPEPTPAEAGVTPEFKALMDKYEAFFDEYAAFMGEMEENSGSLAWLLRYSEMMSRYAEIMEALDAIGEEELSPADYAYYLQTMTRIEIKLLSVLQTGD